MANSTVRTIDPLFLIPDEVGDFEYTEDPELLDDLVADELVVSDDSEQTDAYDDGDEAYFDDPDVPDVFTVVEQVIRTMENGTQVIDLIVDVEDIAGVEKYDFRVVQI